MAEVLDRSRDAVTKKKGASPVVNEAANILAQINDQEVEWVHLRFTNPKGKWRRLTMASGVVDEDQLTDGFIFARSLARWLEAINESDMLLMPPPDYGLLDPFTRHADDDPVLQRREPSTGELYTRDPARPQRAPKLSKEPPASRTPSSSVPRPNSSCSTTCASRTATTPRATDIETSSCQPTRAANIERQPGLPAPREGRLFPRRRPPTAQWTSAMRWSQR